MKEFELCRHFSVRFSSVLVLFLLFTLVPLSAGFIQQTSTTKVNVSPSSLTSNIGQNFSINVTISDVLDLYGWEFKLSWDSTLLDAVSLIEGSFLKSDGSTFFSYKVNNTVGHMVVDCTLLGDTLGVNGSGTLAMVEFETKSSGESILDLYNTTLVSSLLQAITHVALNGNVTVEASDPVGGIYIQVNKLELSAPYIGLAVLLAVALVALAYVKKRKRSTEINS